MIYKSLFSTCVSALCLKKQRNKQTKKTLPTSLHEFTEEGLSKLPKFIELNNDATKILNYVCWPLAQTSARHTVGSR